MNPHFVARIIAFYASHGNRCKVGQHPDTVELYCKLAWVTQSSVIGALQYRVDPDCRKLIAVAALQLVPASAVNCIRFASFWQLLNYCTPEEQQQVAQLFKEHYVGHH